MKYYGPYLRKDNRQVMVIIKDDGTKTSMSYARYLMQQHLGRILESWEEVDHIDNDKTNDSIENLQILSRKENILKERSLPQNQRKMYSFICVNCNQPAIKYLNQVKSNHKKGKTGPFCSRRCAGQYTYKNPWDKYTDDSINA